MENLRRDEGDPDTHYGLFRNTRALPRAWCASRVVPADRDGTLSAIRSGTLPDGGEFEPRRDALVAAGLRPAPYAEANAEAQVRFDAARPHRFEVDATFSCVLVISEVTYPWWRASLDGRPANIFQVDHTLIGVNVPTGSHTVDLTLRPVSVWVGSAISGVSALVLLGVVLLRPARRPAASSTRADE